MNIRPYYESLSEMSEDVREVAQKYWDMTGRTNHENPYVCANIDLLGLCDNFEEYKGKYEELFRDFGINEFTAQKDMRMMWMVYLAGMHRVIEDL